MSNTVLVIGESGAGKSTSLRNLKPEETFILNVLGKPFPFRGASKVYTKLSEDRTTGNLFSTDDNDRVLKAIRFVDAKRPEIKNLVIDDFSYLMTNEYMNRSSERGFDKYSEMAKNAWEIIQNLNATRADLNCFVIAHSETDELGRVKCKTIGKVLSNKVILEGMVTCVMHAVIVEGNYKFLTQDNGTYLAKSPMGMFKDRFIDNDLAIVKDAMEKYFNEDIHM
jgi:hypothetical protein